MPWNTNTTTATRLVRPAIRFLITLVARKSSVSLTERIASSITLIPAPK
jgi:hypothetical protein